MSSEKSHLDQSKHNNEFLKQIRSQKFYDWVATTMFYTALHQIDFYLAKKNIHPINHKVRRAIVNKSFRIEFYKSFRNLEEACYDARYKPDEWKKSLNSITLKELE